MRVFMEKPFSLAIVILGCLIIPITVTANVLRGDILYTKHCAPCHGITGDGQGTASYLLSPKPRDFTSGTYKFRSTPSGSPPTDQDLLRTLKNGVPGTSMPAWDRLPEKDLVTLVEYIKSFSGVFEDDDLEPPIVVSSPPPMTPQSVREGKKVYELMKCGECHGTEGKGDGPSASTLKDDSGFPIRPYDFTLGASVMKGGASPQDIYRTFMTGLDGTPMPSFDFLKDMGDQSWQLVHYIQSLSSKSQKPGLSKGTPTLKAVKAPLNPSSDLEDLLWKKAQKTIVPLRPLWSRDNSLDSVEVQITIGPEITAIRLEWQDTKKDNQVMHPQQFRDAVSIQYAPNGSLKDYVGLPFIGMGDENKMVTIWHWKADWEDDIQSGFQDTVKYYGKTMDQMISRADLTSEDLFLAGLAADNPLSNRKRKSSVETLIAKGFGTLTSLPAEEQKVKGYSKWNNGIWTVVMQIPNSATFPLEKGQALPIAVAIWDGDKGDRNGQKVVSQWMELVIDDK